MLLGEPFDRLVEHAQRLVDDLRDGSHGLDAARDLARQRDRHCAGLLSPAHFEGTRKVGIDLLDLGTGISRPLAEADDRPSALRTLAYRFNADTLEWGAAVLNRATPCDLLLVDELGPLELKRGEGWVNALEILRAGQFQFTTCKTG